MEPRVSVAAGRVATCWCSPGFSVDLNLCDQASHRVALYLLDCRVRGDAGGFIEQQHTIDGAADSCRLDQCRAGAGSGALFLGAAIISADRSIDQLRQPHAALD